ncbi:MAG: glycosyltransferase family 4 protein [Deltaproteobacteria bacterium]|nr:glycosyltransferase family 4 protein [Deltaproteobacteria bacterium]
MKIALVSAFDFAYPGGVNSHIQCLAQHLGQMGHDVRILAPFSEGRGPAPQNLVPMGASFPFPSAGSIARCSPSPFLGPTIDAILERENFDIVHVHEPLTPALPLTMVWRSTVPTVGTFHAYHGTPVAYHLFKPFLRSAAARLDGLTAVSKAAAEFVSQVFPGDYQIIPNGIELEHFNDSVLPISELVDDKLNLLFVGRLEKRKGLDYLLRAFVKIKSQVPATRLIVVGSGSARVRRRYARLVERLQLEDVVFTGYVPDAVLPRYYRTADVFCTPATGHESFGIVLLEGMALGKPIVASNIPGYAGVVTHGREGLLVPPKDPSSLARALVFLLMNESLRHEMGARGKATAARYSWKGIAKRLEGLYEDVLAKRAAAPAAARVEVGVSELPLLMDPEGSLGTAVGHRP